MQVMIDRAGRIVVPKPLRDALALAPGTLLQMDLVGSHIEISNPATEAEIVEGPHGPVVAGTGNTITDGT